jgi:hypothetical protein
MGQKSNVAKFGENGRSGGSGEIWPLEKKDFVKFTVDLKGILQRFRGLLLALGHL